MQVSLFFYFSSSILNANEISFLPRFYPVLDFIITSPTMQKTCRRQEYLLTAGLLHVSY